MVTNKAREGSALLTALFIMTLVAIVATAMTTRLQLDIYRTQLVVNHDKMVLASQSVIFWAIGELQNPKKHFRQSRNNGEVAATPTAMKQLIAQMEIQGKLYDLQAGFNLNNLVDRKAIPPFLFLIGFLNPSMETSEQLSVVNALREWIIPYSLDKGKNPLMEYYLSQDPAYIPAHQPLQSLSELRLIKGFSPELITLIEPYVTTLPEPTPLNINTASATTLSSLGHGLKEAQINDLIMARGETGIKKIEEIGDLLKKFDIPQEQITISSQYFKSVAKVRANGIEFVMISVLKRTHDAKGNISVQVLYEYSYNS